ncbi:MAG: cytochrome c biogenesis protein CcsA [Thermodesulforhabdaceae bacterium]|jgi:cytochrome c-type biogenesis protein CcsB
MLGFLAFIALMFYSAGMIGYFICIYFNRPSLTNAVWWLVVLGAGFHLTGLVTSILFSSVAGTVSIHREALMAVALFIVVLFLVVSRLRPVGFMGAVIMPVVVLAQIGSSLLPFEENLAKPFLRNGIVIFHIATLFVAYAFFALSFSLSLIYLLQERKIKRKEFKVVAGFSFPSLETIDRLNHRCILIGFPFMTAGLIAGFGAAQLFWKSSWTGDPKEILSIITWCVYAVLFHQRLALGWRGKKASWVAICGFVSVLITFIGVNLYGKTHHITFFLR